MKKPKQSIVLIGAGNVATRLGIALKKEGYTIVQVYSRTRKSANSLALKLKCSYTTSLEKLNPDAAIYLIAVNDDHIGEVAKQLHPGKSLVVHTSGSVPLEVLSDRHANTGILYPLQTLQKEVEADLRSVPILIEGNNPGAGIQLRQLAKDLSANVMTADSETRRYIHLTAVIACNLSNHLFAQAQQLLREKGLPADLLSSLILETARKGANGNAAKTQTGPAARGDRKVMRSHIRMLESKPELKKIYQLLSASIMNGTKAKKKK